MPHSGVPEGPRAGQASQCARCARTWPSASTTPRHNTTSGGSSTRRLTVKQPTVTAVTCATVQVGGVSARSPWGATIGLCRNGSRCSGRWPHQRARSSPCSPTVLDAADSATGRSQVWAGKVLAPAESGSPRVTLGGIRAPRTPPHLPQTAEVLSWFSARGEPAAVAALAADGAHTGRYAIGGPLGRESARCLAGDAGPRLPGLA